MSKSVVKCHFLKIKPLLSPKGEDIAKASLEVWAYDKPKAPYSNKKQ